jgi:hypothetical protein
VKKKWNVIGKEMLSWKVGEAFTEISFAFGTRKREKKLVFSVGKVEAKATDRRSEKPQQSHA